MAFAVACAGLCEVHVSVSVYCVSEPYCNCVLKGNVAKFELQLLDELNMHQVCVSTESRSN